MDEFPLAREFLARNLRNNELLGQLEEELSLQEELIDEFETLRPELEQLMIDATLATQGALIATEFEDDMGEANEMMQGCLAQIMEMENLLVEVGLQDSLYYTVERQQQRAESKSKVQEARADHENKQNGLLESRDVVKEMRLEQADEAKAEKSKASVDKGLEHLDLEWTITIRDLKDNRNKKTLNIMKMGESINALQAQFEKMNLIKNGGAEEEEDSVENDMDDMKAGDDPQASLKASATDFLNDFLFKKSTEDDSDEVEESEMEASEEEQAPIRSILVKKPAVEETDESEEGNEEKEESPLRAFDFLDKFQLKRASDESEQEDPDLLFCSPAKRVRFASSPDLNQILEVEEPDWPTDSEEAEERNQEVDPPLDDEEVEVSEEELEESSDGEFEIESDDEIEISEEVKKVEMPEEKSDSDEKKSDSDDKESGSEIEEFGSEHKESGGEASGEEEPDEGAGKAKFLDLAPEKPEILNVDIIPPRRVLYPEDNDDVPSTSSGIRNRFTNSQFSKHAMDHTIDSQAKRIKLDEEQEVEEFPMAQPMPSTFESNDDHILQFASPESNALDDYLLNFSDDNDVGLDGPSYIL
ncbi:nucleolar protein 58 [Drosophila takahashii]|uniref:nucleolar protein 58 n=1 Tax=Drosophila takahashii TaxID=29030 RepID=UPI001CF8696A|nr:protein IWS1 homolog [Drosophila takahashii]